MDRNEFIDLLSDELFDDPDNNRLNRILEAADEYAEYVHYNIESWIDINEGLPDRIGYYLTSNEYYNVRNDFFDGDYFETAKMYHYKVIAWRELPKPYKKENQNDR